MNSHNEQNTYQTVRIASIGDDARGKGPCGLGLFQTPCRILCGISEESDACLLQEKLASLELPARISACADKTASHIRQHPLKSLAVAGIIGLLVGRLVSRSLH